MKVPIATGILSAIVIAALIHAVGRRAVIGTKVVGTLILSGGYAAFALAVLLRTRGLPSEPAPVGDHDWILSAAKYVGYNTVTIPASLYSMRWLTSRKQVLASSLIASLLLIAPMAMVAVSIRATGATAELSPVPLHEALVVNGNQALLVLYYAIFVWTLMDTGIGLVFSIAERAESYLIEETGRRLAWWHRALATAAFLALAALLAPIGIIKLVSGWYGAMSYAFMVILIIPLLTRGVQRIMARK